LKGANPKHPESPFKKGLTPNTQKPLSKAILFGGPGVTPGHGG